MTITKKLVSALCLVLLFSNSSDALADSTTGNLINFSGTPTDTTGNWVNGVYVNQLGCFGGNTPGNCGPNPNVQTNGVINFSYGQVDLHQIVNINSALAAGGSGVQLSGFNFGFMAKNGNGWDDGRQDYLSAYVKFYNAGGGLAANYDYTSQTNQRYGWTQFNFNETFANPTAATNYSNAQVGFVGRDNNYWAGPYGPEIFNVSFSLKYRVDPCSTNPAYSSTCAGFGSIINSNNLLDSTRGGGSLNQVFAVNTALGLAGSGATVHGFNYGFTYTVGQGFFGCTAWNQDGSCSWMMNTPAYVNAAVSFTNSNNQIIRQQNYSFTSEGTSGSVSEKYLLPSSMNQTLLGTGRIMGSASGTGSSISGAWANIIYTADPCAVNPLSSASCAGYAVAYAKTLVPSSTVSNELTPANPGPQTQPEMSPGQQLPSGQGGPGVAGNDPGSNGNNSNNRTADSGSKSSNGNASAPSLTNILGMISNNQAKISSTEKSVVQAAESQAMQAGQQAQQQAESVAGSLTAQSIAGSLAQSGAVSGLAAPGSQSQLSSLLNSTGLISGAASSGTGLRLQTPSMSDILNSINAGAFQNTPESYGLQLPQERNAAQYAPDIPQTEGFKMGSNSALSNAIEQQFVPLSIAPEQKSETVKRDTPPNDLARGVDIAAMALQPQGYTQYSVVMTDVPFYAPKEIYKNQNTVDNVRVLRQLSNDQLHQNLVNQQYK